ncbi:hypothetical protein Thimo_0310 [Thioflavicoccus mobilis 8321]|uniref:Uncharacterized protein n=1 Tax=Thioflavicoccus mobilis 8321 TaxID=765912 RepID=L0GUY6_9GAMM|nr:hypothetical protein Thimo_0310 [Thioflavicoccus mobilis 8321]
MAARSETRQNQEMASGKGSLTRHPVHCQSVASGGIHQASERFLRIRIQLVEPIGVRRPLDAGVGSCIGHLGDAMRPPRRLAGMGNRRLQGRLGRLLDVKGSHRLMNIQISGQLAQRPMEPRRVRCADLTLAGAGRAQRRQVPDHSTSSTRNRQIALLKIRQQLRQRPVPTTTRSRSE